MQPEEVTAVGEVAGEAIAGVARHVRDLHEGIAKRVWRSVGPMATPVQAVHDRVASSVYGGVSRSLIRAAQAGAKAASLRTAPDAPSLQRSPASRFALGALNGAFGDKLEQRGNALAWPMTLRVDGADVEPNASALAAAYPSVSPRLAVFVHGLCETEEAWGWGAARHVPYGERLRTELGYTPLYIRYNTGRHISENGRTLGRLLERVTEAWPVEIDELALVGHSMGGLVSRSATHYAAGSAWTGKVRHVFSLGSPHRGAPLELAAYAACSALRRLP